MRVFKTRPFSKWANSEALSDRVLATAVVEMEQGSIDARLGGRVVKKRIALPGRGKRSGACTLLVFEQGRLAVFIYGFAKSDRANVSEKELEALKLLATELLSYSAAMLTKAVGAGELIEIEVNDDG